MNCPKCGSNNIRTERRPNGFNWCNECGHQWQSGIKSPEPTTAEKLLWLAENESVDIWHTASGEIAIIWRNGERYKFIFKTLAEAINAAYKWVKEARDEEH